MSKIAILHDSFGTVGGGGYVAVTTAKIFNAPIYTSTKTIDFYDKEVEIIPLARQKSKRYAIELVKRAKLFRELKIEADIVISSGEENKFYEPGEEQKHVNYTHAPPRVLYDLKDMHRQQLVRFPKKGILFDLFCFYWKKKFKKALNNIDKLLCNSEVIRDWIRKFWGVESEVIYPPVEISKYKCKPSEDYYLFISRLNFVKRPKVVIEAFKNLNEKLVVVGEDKGGFCKFMTKNIDYRGQVSEGEKIDLLARCKAVIYPPIEEEFGLVPIEAFASGKPVIGVKEGFTKYQINEETRIFIEPTPKGVINGIRKLEKKEWYPRRIRDYAKNYDISVFEEKLRGMY